MTYVSNVFTFEPAPAALAPGETLSLHIRDERICDVAAREALLDASFGADRHAKTSERLREGRIPASGLALSAMDAGQLVGTLRFWHVRAGDRQALLLGPLAIAASHRSHGLGTRLICEGLFRALVRGHKSVLLVGDLAYYERFGFSRSLTSGLILPGPVDRARFLGLELEAGALKGAVGLVEATGLPLALDVQRAA